MMNWDEKGDKIDKIIKKIFAIQKKAFKSGTYICHECGSPMHFDDEWEQFLICDNCGHGVSTEEYGFEGYEKYNDDI